LPDLDQRQSAFFGAGPDAVAPVAAVIAFDVRVELRFEGTLEADEIGRFAARHRPPCDPSLCIRLAHLARRRPFRIMDLAGQRTVCRPVGVEQALEQRPQRRADVGLPPFGSGPLVVQRW